jgi:hypothetical protein
MKLQIADHVHAMFYSHVVWCEQLMFGHPLTLASFDL